LTINVLVGLFSRGDIMRVALMGLLGGIIFGIGGLLVGNLLNGYIINAAKREITRRAVERELAEELAERRSGGEGPSSEGTGGVEG
jgi:hypothetical protein